MTSRLLNTNLQLRRLSLMLVLVAAQLGLLAIVATSADATAARWYLRNSNSAGAANITFNYGNWGGTMSPVAGDWNNDGVDSIGMFDTAGGSPANWYLRNSNSAGAHDIFREYGRADGRPVVGNWKCEGDQTNVYKDGAWYLRRANGNTEVQHLGSSTSNPVLGDPVFYNPYGDYCDTPAVQNPATGHWTWHVRPFGDWWWYFYYGSPGDVPLMGDWNGDGDDTPGVYRSSTSTFYLAADIQGQAPGDGGNPGYYAQYSFIYGNPGWKPVAGDWNGDGIDTIGLVAPSP